MDKEKENGWFGKGRKYYKNGKGDKSWNLR